MKRQTKTKKARITERDLTALNVDRGFDFRDQEAFMDKKFVNI